MPRTGGESDKLGNRYEGWWTVSNLLEVLAGDAVSLQPEPYEESKGVEFIKTGRDLIQEFHSVKRQRHGAGWTLSELAGPDERGRSVLKDLFDKLGTDSSRRVVFVSMTIHSQAYEVWDRAQRCQTPIEFEQQLKTDRVLYEDFRKYILPLCHDEFSTAFTRFKSLTLVSIGENQLKHHVEFSVRLLVYRIDDAAVNASQVVLTLGDFVCSSLGRRLLESDIRGELERYGYYLRDWGRDNHISSQVETLNKRYLKHVEADFIIGREIPRLETTIVTNALLEQTSKLAQLVVGVAGRGKSCLLAQVLRQLEKQEVRFLAIRLDNIPVVGSTKALGLQLGLPDSPAIVLAGLSQGALAVLVVDQLDAMSIVSGRNAELWQVFEELIEEVKHHPKMRLLLACRAFDLENDPRLARLAQTEGPAQRVDLDLLPANVVQQIIKEGGGTPERMAPRELELLRTPFHLFLFLQGEPGNPIPFSGIKGIFDRFWTTKCRKADQQNVDFVKVVGLLADELNRIESISVPIDRLDSVVKGADVLVSQNVLILENGRYRFFHESFFDYAFARQFVREGHDLIRFLTCDCGEQHLFRRSQVRQILTYQREDNRDAYLKTLASLFIHKNIRIHVKKLALEWLGHLDDPCQEEWVIVEPLLVGPIMPWATFNFIWGRVAWFDLLEKTGIFQRLLSGDNTDLIDRCLCVLGQKEFLEQRSKQVAALLRSHRQKDVSVLLTPCSQIAVGSGKLGKC